MKRAPKAFTLVELIVVITLLAILATITFINLAGYNKDARNGKVISDLRNIAGSVEVTQTVGNVKLIDTIVNTSNNNSVASSNILNNSGATLGDIDTTYRVGNIDFSAIQQNGKDFMDPNSFDQKQDYVYAIVFHSDFSYFQFAGQVFDNDIKKARIIGTYAVQDTVQDVASLISTQANDTPIEDNKPIIGDLYQ